MIVYEDSNYGGFMSRKKFASILLLSTVLAIGPVVPGISLAPGDFDRPRVSTDLSKETDSAGNPPKTSRYGFKLAANGENLAMVWSDDRLDDEYGVRNNEVYIRTSNNSGQNWGPVFNLSSQPVSDWEPSVAISGDAAVVAFGETGAVCNGCPEILNIVRFSNGQAERVFKSEKFRWAVEADVYASGPNVIVTAGESEIHHTTSRDGGKTWSQLQVWNPSGENDFNERSNSRLFFDGTTLYQAVRAKLDGRLTQPEIVVRTSSDFGLTWNPEVRLSSTPQEDITPVIYGNSSEIFVAYGVRVSERRLDVVVHSSKDSGRSWSNPQTMTSITDSIYSIRGPVLDMKTLANGKHMGLLASKEIVFSSDGKTIENRRAVSRNVNELEGLTIGSRAAFLVKNGVVYTSLPGGSATTGPEPKRYSNCTSLNRDYAAGVAQSASSRNKGNRIRLKPVVNAAVYKLNRALDRDRDGLVCEK